MELNSRLETEVRKERKALVGERKRLYKEMIELREEKDELREKKDELRKENKQFWIIEADLTKKEEELRESLSNKELGLAREKEENRLAKLSDSLVSVENRLAWVRTQLCFLGDRLASLASRSASLASQITSVVIQLTSVEFQLVRSAQQMSLSIKPKFADVKLLPYPEGVIDQFMMKNWTEGTTRDMSGLTAFFEFLGGFPSKYYIRGEVCQLFKAVENTLWENVEQVEGEQDEKSDRVQGERKGRNRVCIVGSPGVGKSAFYVAYGLYLAIHRKQTVMMLRKSKDEYEDYQLLVLQPHGFYCWDNFYLEKSSAFGVFQMSFRRAYQRDFWFFLDGATQDDMKSYHGIYHCFCFLVTPLQYFDTWKEEHTTVCVLPSWSFEDLSLYGRSVLGLSDEEIKERYYISGGSLRIFSMESIQAMSRLMKRILQDVSPENIEVLFSKYGRRCKSSLNKLRMTTVQNVANWQEYFPGFTTLTYVDSLYAMNALRTRIQTNEFIVYYNIAKSINGPAFGWAFKHAFHRHASHDNPITLNHVGKYGSFAVDDEVTFSLGKAIHSGKDLVECKEALQAWCIDESKNYWYPEYSSLPSVDSVAKIKFQSSNVVAFIQLTTSKVLTMDEDFLKDLVEVGRGSSDSCNDGGEVDRVMLIIVPDQQSLNNFKIVFKKGTKKGMELIRSLPIYISCWHH